MSKTIFMKYLPPKPKLVPKSKMLRIYWNLTSLIFQDNFDFNVKNDFYKIFITCSARIRL